MSRGGRDIFRSIHKLRTMPRSPLWPAQTRQHQQRQVAVDFRQVGEEIQALVDQRWAEYGFAAEPQDGNGAKQRSLRQLLRR